MTVYMFDLEIRNKGTVLVSIFEYMKYLVYNYDIDLTIHPRKSYRWRLDSSAPVSQC